MNTPAASSCRARLLAHRAIRAGLLICFVGTAHAGSTIYRCGVSGNLYSDQPCADGRLLSTRDERSESQRAEAARVALQEGRYAAELRRERLMLEAAAPRLAAGLTSRPPAAIKVLAVTLPAKRQSHPRSPRASVYGDDFIAFVPPVRRTR